MRARWSQIDTLAHQSESIRTTQRHNVGPAKPCHNVFSISSEVSPFQIHGRLGDPTDDAQLCLLRILHLDHLRPPSAPNASTRSGVGWGGDPFSLSKVESDLLLTHFDHKYVALHPRVITELQKKLKPHMTISLCPCCSMYRPNKNWDWDISLRTAIKGSLIYMLDLRVGIHPFVNISYVGMSTLVKQNQKRGGNWWEWIWFFFSH